jgi:hypothetical protein
MEFSQKVGDTSFIYYYPGVSNLVFNKGYVYLIWDQYKNEGESDQLHLVRYNLRNGEYNDTPLSFKSTWNISISLRESPEVLCLAYHGVNHDISVEFLPLDIE